MGFPEIGIPSAFGQVTYHGRGVWKSLKWGLVITVLGDILVILFREPLI
ncbi:MULTISPECIES: hypothetical protein [unclassified Paenibacillus]|nr:MULTISPECIES: hypothetical protein [unclassified Paenibacillus]MBP1157410.1 hypothetical protein [Paenibacillus sp. PvP091]MBP1171852.1 hypothetical protein [Paenibacillus sp. PvR098]MBP2438233.1 hypothetical protein [Paenibacillus sp. PvP052]